MQEARPARGIPRSHPTHDAAIGDDPHIDAHRRDEGVPDGTAREKVEDVGGEGAEAAANRPDGRRVVGAADRQRLHGQAGRAVSLDAGGRGFAHDPHLEARFVQPDERGGLGAIAEGRDGENLHPPAG